MNVITRFAPSPTGSLHIGGIHNAMRAYALARKHGGKFILRLEDTDQKREVAGSAEEIQRMLEIYGLKPDEVMRQSGRLAIYQEYAKKLVEMGAAYYCFATAEQIDAERNLAMQNKQPFKFRSPYRDLPIADAKAKIASGAKYTIRQKLPDDTVVEFNDPVLGLMSFNTKDVDEGVLLKTDGFPTYHLAVVVDDHLMEVTHVFRGVEWIPSVPKHVLLYKNFGWEMPVITHTAVILDPDGGKLSKRKGSVAAKEFLAEGYLPEAILNFLMLLGWSSPIAHEHGEKERELFTLNEFVELFDIKDLNKQSPVFNREKLLWFNQKYIQLLSDDDFQIHFTTWLKENLSKDEKYEGLLVWIMNLGPDKLQKILELEKPRIATLADLPAAMDFYYDEGSKVNFAEVKQTKKLTAEQIQKILTDFVAETDTKNEELTDWAHEEWEAFVRAMAEQMEIKAGEVFMTLRLAVTGRPNTPPLHEVMQILGRDEVSRRIKNYL